MKILIWTYIYKYRPGKTILDVDNVWFTLLTLNPQQIHFGKSCAEKTEWKQYLVDSTFTLDLMTGISFSTISGKKLFC